MMRLVKAECKKILRSKFNIFMILILFSYTGYQAYSEYQFKFQNTVAQEWIMKTTEGKDLNNGADYFMYADKILHQYEGKASPKLYEKFMSDYEKILEAYPLKDYDVDYMISLYGTEYEKFMQDCVNGKYSEQKRIEYLENVQKQSYFFKFYKDDDNDNLIYPMVFYENDHVRLLYQNIYKNTMEYNYYLKPAKDIPDLGNFKAYCLASNAEIMKGLDLSDPLNKTMKEHFVNQEQNQHFDSVVGNNLFVNALGCIDFVTLLMIALILSNTFAMENYYKTDQILIPSETAMKKLSLAKLLAGILVSVGILLLEYLMIYMFTMIYVPLRDLNMETISMAGTSVKSITNGIFTYKEIIGTGLFLNLLAVISTASITMLASFISKNRFITIILLITFILITTFSYPFDTIFHNFGDHLFLANMLHTNDFFLIFRYGNSPEPYGLWNGIFYSWKTIIVLFWMIVDIIITLIVWKISKKHVVKNH